MNKENEKLISKRLKLRQWREEDQKPFANINSDPLVMAFFPNPLSQEQSNLLAVRLEDLIHRQGYGFWAVELLATGEFIGFVGLNPVEKESGIPHSPMVEIGWRLASEHWGKGYAPEAARLALAFGFDNLKLDCIYSFTSLLNLPSQRVMQKIGMQDTQIQFGHPKLASGHALKPHCLYQIDKQTWRKLQDGSKS